MKIQGVLKTPTEDHEDFFTVLPLQLHTLANGDKVYSANHADTLPAAYATLCVGTRFRNALEKTVNHVFRRENQSLQSFHLLSC